MAPLSQPAQRSRTLLRHCLTPRFTAAAHAHLGSRRGRRSLQALSKLRILDATAEDDLPKFVSMALPLTLRAMTHERYSTGAPEPLDESERELLTMILDCTAARVDRSVHE